MSTSRPSSDLPDPVTDTSSSHILAERLRPASETEDWATLFCLSATRAGSDRRLRSDDVQRGRVTSTSRRARRAFAPCGFRASQRAVEPLARVTVALFSAVSSGVRLGTRRHEPKRRADERGGALAGAMSRSVLGPDQLGLRSLFARRTTSSRYCAPVYGILRGRRTCGRSVMSPPRTRHARRIRSVWRAGPHSWPQVAAPESALADFAAAKDSSPCSTLPKRSPVLACPGR